MSAPPLNEEQRQIAQWLKKVKFRKSLFGVSEKDVWKKISELNEMYQQAIKAERIRYDVLLEEQRKNKDFDGDHPPNEQQEVIH